MPLQEAKVDEESALDAKRRRRFGAPVCRDAPAAARLVRDHWQLHAERDPLHQGQIVERAKLQQRNFSLDLTSRLGKTQVVTNSTPLNQQVGAPAAQAPDPRCGFRQRMSRSAQHISAAAGAWWCTVSLGQLADSGLILAGRLLLQCV